ncbi:ribosomal protein bL12 [Candidatus Omnitrophota bacterium]
MRKVLFLLVVLAFLSVSAYAQTPEEEVQQDLLPGYSVMLLDFGDKKISVIKEVRAIRGIGLKQAKDIVESVPSYVIGGLSLEDAEVIKESLEDIGAVVEIRLNE